MANSEYYPEKLNENGWNTMEQVSLETHYQLSP